MVICSRYRLSTVWSRSSPGPDLDTNFFFRFFTNFYEFKLIFSYFLSIFSLMFNDICYCIICHCHMLIKAMWLSFLNLPTSSMSNNPSVSQPPPSATTTATASIATWLWQWWGHRRAHEGAVAGAREVTHLEPLGTFFFCFIFFYYTNELSRLHPTLAPPQHVTTWKVCWSPDSPPAQNSPDSSYLHSGAWDT